MTALPAGTRVLVTGGAGGIGRAMADAFAAAGARVWVVDPAAAPDGLPPGWHCSRLGVTDEAGMAALFAEVEGAWGGLDVLCANAGTAGPTAPVEDMPLQGFRDCVAINLEGAFLTVRGAAPLMKRARAGAIVLTSSTAGLYGYPNRTPYAAAKWGVIGLMKTLAMELGPFGIRVNALCPGAVEGPRMEGVVAREAAAKGMTPAAVRRGYQLGVSLRAWVTAEDVAAMALFLGSPAARMISGQAIAVDGHTENPDPKP